MNSITKFEKTRIIGYRAEQIALGAEPLVDIKNSIDPIFIAEQEFKQNKIPLTVHRRYPNGDIKLVKLFKLDKK